MTQKSFQYFDDKTELLGYLSYDENTKSPLPAVLICPDWTGCNPFAKQMADSLTKLGLVGFAVDIYGSGKQGATKDEKAALMQPFMQDRAKLQTRLISALNAVKALEFVDSDNIAIIGFCFGGLCALDLARSGADIRGAVSFHGLLTAPEEKSRKKITAKILVLHGYDDLMVPPSQVTSFCDEMTGDKIDWQVHLYGNTLHAFTNPEANDPSFGTVYSDIANTRAMQSCYNFLREIFELNQ